MWWTARFLVIYTLVINNISSGYNILFLHPLHSGSHEVQLRELANSLLLRNHYIKYIKFKNFVQLPPIKHENITFTTLSVNNEDGSIPFVTHEKEGRFLLPLDIMWDRGLSPWGIPFDAFLTMPPYCNRLLSDTKLREELKQSDFDIAIVDLFTNECGLALVNYLNIPAIAYWALPLSGGEAILSSGISQSPGSSPSFMTQLSANMNFIQRARNLFYTLMNRVVMQFQFLITDYSIQKHLPGTPNSKKLLSELSGLLENSDFSLDYARELPPNIINVGCMQCRHARPLSQELEDFMQGAGKAGVILFSMGATFDAAIAPPLLLRRLLKAFSKLPQRIIMKIGGPTPLPNDIIIPDNVRTERWLPQQDVLGHRQVRAFFTHCGLHGALETAWHGVPVIALPVFGDQGDVAEMLKKRGVAVRLDKDATTDQIYTAIRTIIDDPRFKENAKKLQSVIRDQQVSPMERAIWFIEYVARHKGAPHLKMDSRNLSFIQEQCLDVWLTFLFTIYIVYKFKAIPAKFVSKIVNFVKHYIPFQSHFKTQ